MADPLTWMTGGCTLVLLATKCLSTYLLTGWARTITALPSSQGGGEGWEGGKEEREEGKRRERGGGEEEEWKGRRRGGGAKASRGHKEEKVYFLSSIALQWYTFRLHW